MPNSLKTDKEKQLYCDNINKEMRLDSSIAISPETIDPNDYQKNATKAGLNSCLGKLSQSANKPQSIIITNQLDLDLLLNNATKEVTEIVPMGDSLIQARVKTKDGFHRVAQKSSLILGSYVTA